MGDFVNATEAARLTGQSERTIRRWIESCKLTAEKYGSNYRILLTDLEPFLDTKPPDIKILLARIQVLEDPEDMILSQAYRITELEHRVWTLENQTHVHKKRKPRQTKLE